MKRWWLLVSLSILLAAIGLLLPPRARVIVAGAEIPEPVRGTIHVHTRRSDGSGTIDDVAAAAARAGLQFVVFTDHGDATRTPQPPAYRHGVLCVDAVEIATFSGHVVALGLDRAAPYPLGGEPRDVIEDVRRLGGMSLAAHPTSPKPALRWRDWDSGFDGLEWLNADSEWRDEGPVTLLAALLTYPFRRTETLTSLLDRPSDVLAHWDQLLRTRRVVAIAGADAHASLMNGEDNPYSDRSPIALPGYEPSFRTFSVALPQLHLTGDAATDAHRVVEDIEAGRLYTTIDGLAHPARFSFVARSGAHEARMGDRLPLEAPVTLEVRTNAPSDARVVLVHNGQTAAAANGSTLTHQGDATPGYYRVEVYLRAATANESVPWIVSNPIYVGGSDPASTPAFTASTESVRRGLRIDDWGIEESDKSRSVLDLSHEHGATRWLLHYTLGGTREESPYIALAMLAGSDISAFDHLAFRGRADRPTRIWVQLWRPVPTGNEYWRRSIYLDPVERDVVIPFAEMQPATPHMPATVPLSTIVTVQFVFDQLHTPIGSSGEIWIGDVRYQR
jgi:hypothetical protein